MDITDTVNESDIKESECLKLVECETVPVNNIKLYGERVGVGADLQALLPS